MSDEFKKRLEAYEEGELSEVEMKEFDKELDKLETYQSFLDQSLEDTSNQSIDEKKQKRIMRRGKWRARINTTLYVFGLFILISFVSSIITAVYYAWGTPDRSEVYQNIIDHTLTITDPYGYMGSTSVGSNTYFNLTATRDINKVVGSETKKVGELDVKFILSMMGLPNKKQYGSSSQKIPTFFYPDDLDDYSSDWEQLKKVSDGTVASAYVSFTDFLETEDVFQHFESKDMDLLWLAVDTGIDEHDYGNVFDPIGFPSYPIWHEDDMILDSREEQKGFFGSKIISEGHSSPDYEEGDGELLHKQFIKTLDFLQEHKRKSANVYDGQLDLEDRISYIDENGIAHYGAVITGPSKEILKLKDEDWISTLEIDEISFWNWESWE